MRGGRIEGSDAFLLAISQGHVPEVTCVNKFGRNIEIDSGVAADVWDGGHTVASGGVSLTWVAPTASRVHQIVSTATSDASGDVGAKTIQVYGLTDWDTPEISEVITMNGTTNVPTTNSYVIIHRIKVLTKGTSGPNVGTITATADTDGTITAQVRAGQGQTQMAIYGIPSTRSAYMIQYYFSVNKSGGTAGGVDISLLVNPEPDVEETTFVHKHTLGVMTTGNSHTDHAFKPPFRVPGPAIIKIHGHSGANNLDVSAGFDLVIAKD